MIVNVAVLPLQEILLFVYIGVTVTVLINGRLPLFIAVNAGILPFPELARLIPLCELVQLYDVPVPVNRIAPVLALLQITWLLTWLLVGVGFTVIEKSKGVPGHDTPLLVKVGITLIDADIGALLEF